MSEGAPIGFLWLALPTRLRAAGVEITDITWLAPVTAFSLIAAFLLFHAFAAATQDVAIDALLMDLTHPTIAATQFSTFMGATNGCQVRQPRSQAAEKAVDSTPTGGHNSPISLRVTTDQEVP